MLIASLFGVTASSIGYSYHAQTRSARVWELVEQAKAETEGNDLAPAAEHATQALKEDPSLPDAWVALAKVYLERGQPRAALIQLHIGLRRSPQQPELWQEAGMIYASLKQYRRAAAYFEQALRVYPGYYQAELALPLAYEKSGDLEQALAELESLKYKYPGNASLRGDANRVAAALNQQELARSASSQ